MAPKLPRTAKEYILLYFKEHGSAVPKDVVAHYDGKLNPETLRWTMSKVMIPKGLLSRDESGLYSLTEAGRTEAGKFALSPRAPAQKDAPKQRGPVYETSTELSPYAALEDVDDLVRKHTLRIVEEALSIYKRIKNS